MDVSRAIKESDKKQVAKFLALNKTNHFYRLTGQLITRRPCTKQISYQKHQVLRPSRHEQLPNVALKQNASGTNGSLGNPKGIDRIIPDYIY